MLQNVYRFVVGWLCIEFYGDYASRCLNLCSRHGICMWHIRRLNDQTVALHMYVRDLHKLRPILRKTHVRLRICGRRGLPFIVRRYRMRKMFVAVAMISIAAAFYLSTKIWKIEFVGNSSISEETLLCYLQDKQIAYGTSRAAIDNDALELSLRQDFDSIIWASVYEEGTKLVVCIQEKIASDRSAGTAGNTPMDIVANKDAQIISIITRKGVANVKTGDRVSRGDILVSGRQTILDDRAEVKQYYYEVADADVIGKVSYDYEDWIAADRVVAKRTGRKHVRYFLRMGSCQLTTPAICADFENAVKIEQLHQICLFDHFYLPAYVGSKTEYEEERTLEKVDLHDAKSIAIKHFEHFLANLEQNGVSIIDKNVMIEKIDLKYHIYGNVTAEESITRQQPAEILPDPVQLTDEGKEETMREIVD